VPSAQRPATIGASTLFATTPPARLATVMQNLIAGLALAVCAVLLLRLALGERRRWRFDAALRRGWQATRRRSLALLHWRASRRAAAEAAAQAIRRARAQSERDGNVYRPKSFQKPPNDTLH